jgi:penicillin-binding protein 1C
MKALPLRLARRTLVAAGAAGAVIVVGLLALHAAFPFPRARLGGAERNGCALILDRDGGLIAWRVGTSDEWRLPVPIGSVSPWLAMATIAAEDKRFLSHPGVDPAAALRALGQNVAGGRRVSGASTITMQVMRLLEPRRRTYAAKALESFRALQLERAAGKDEVLQLYLNLAPYGGNVVGAEAAARLYFGKGAEHLTLGEAALLAGVPQRPARFNPRKHLAAALERREYVLGRMRDLGFVTPDEAAAARRERIALTERPSRPDTACFADWVIARRGHDCGMVRTTLDPVVQATVHAAVQRHRAEMSALGVDGLAAVVLGVEESELLAMVGSADPSDPLSGQVNSATSLRQPGSLLKPFIYARAYGLGMLTPDSVVFDVPTAWPGYSPENMDRQFLGPITARRALAESRNLPAVRLLARLSVASLAGDMAALGIPTDSAARSYGLSLALGTAEVRLVDVANAYAALARLGRWRPLRATAGEPRGRGREVYPSGAAYLALRSLGAATPDEPPRIAWKTGTSWNQRDAWAVVLTPAHVVAIWCGKLSGEGHPVLVGAHAALPPATEIAGLLPGGGNWQRPASVRLRRACGLSGAPSGADCPDVTEGEYLPGISSEVACRVHRAVDEGGGRQVVEVWPPDVDAWLASPPGLVREGERRVAERLAPVVLSPRAGARYVLAGGKAPGNVLHMQARTDADAGGLYWFVDGELLGRFLPGEDVCWPLRPGRHEVLASDGRRSAAPVTFTVERRRAGQGGRGQKQYPRLTQ